MIDSPESSKPAIKHSRRISKVWIIPIVGLFLGIWLVNRSIEEKGQLITVTFENAEGIVIDKTEVRCRNVRIGIVESIDLDPKDLTVEVGLRIKHQHFGLIRKDSKLWVVRPRVSGASISGLGTLVSGSYIDLDPGQSKEDQYHFVGLETPPLTPNSVPGLRLFLDAKDPGSIDVGSGIYFMGNMVGKVESRTFHANSRKTEFGIFIDLEYAALVNTETRFWRDSGFELKIDSSGIDLEVPTLDSLIAGRVNFGTPEGLDEGQSLSPNHVEYFTLHNSEDAADTSAFRSAAQFLLLLDQSVKGLGKGSPVEFRGLPVGRVDRISYNLVESSQIDSIPVLIELDEHLLAKHFPPSLRNEGENGLKEALKKGLHASIKSSNLLTGQMYVDLDYYSDLPAAEVKIVSEHIVIPTTQTGLARIEAVIEKINKLEIEPLLAKVTEAADEASKTLQGIQDSIGGADTLIAETKLTMEQTKEMMAALNEIMNDPDTKALPTEIRNSLAEMQKGIKPFSEEGAVYGDLLRTMDELRNVSRSIKRMTTEIADKPNSLLFGKDPNSNKIPRARK
ncbi:MlaD family protein [Akkermansiaceae bacterium]|nr:MlaD family protein [Akkermansiaceae bacterium]